MPTTLKAAPAETPSPVMGTLAIMGFAAEENLRKVAHALGQRNRAELVPVEERNAKQPRLRAEVEEQILHEMEQFAVGTRSRRKLLLASRVATLFERMGNHTVEIARLCDQILQETRPTRVTEIRKLIDHAVYITDRAATGLVEDDLPMARIAQEQNRAALVLCERVRCELAALAVSRGDGASRVHLLTGISCRAQDMIEEAGRLADEVIDFLQSSEF
jgi:hypothetical protein